LASDLARKLEKVWKPETSVKKPRLWSNGSISFDLLYNADTWTLKEEQIGKLSVIERSY